MKTYKKIEELYNKIPAFKCKEGCTDCCGPVPFARSEWARVEDKRTFQGKMIDCPYSLEGHCDIYAQRPFMCRIFGATVDPGLKCPHGCAPDKPLSATEARQLTDSYVKMMGGE